jgi:hypothetical protein
VLKLNYKNGEQMITVPEGTEVVAFVKAPSASELAVGRKVFVLMKKDSPEGAAVVIGADGSSRQCDLEGCARRVV